MTVRPIEYIGAGSFAVRGRQNLILEALLGACVGIVLFDRTADVGGLLHLLLPEPIGSGNPWQPENYASTGLPIFIESLCQAGAEKSRLEAFVAGGALTGKVSKQDLDIDIGGRTTDVVMNILDREAIRIRQSETGGLFSMGLCLDLNAWECNIKPVIEQPVTYEGEIKKPTADEINQAIARLRPIPQVALKIVRMIGDERYNLQDAAEEIRKDQIIAAKVLNLCNSAMIGCAKHMDSVDDALMIIGEKMLLRLVVSASMELFFPESEHGYSQCRGRLYHHAIGTAIVAEKISRITGRSNPTVAYTAGLLHDIGKVVLDHFIAGNFPFFYRSTHEGVIHLEQAEEEMLGIGHPEVGGRLADLWSFPQNLTEAIRYHHQPEKATTESELAHIVYLADLIISMFWVSRALERQNTDFLAARFRKLGLNSGHLTTIVDSIPWNALNSLKS